MYQRIGKRVLDITVALPMLIVSLPILILAIVILLCTSRESPFYLHQRPGFKERPFTLFKLRTMRNRVRDSDVGNSNLARVTRIGALMRASSIDELPQLVNVLRGDLSLVGPRPLEMRYLPHYNTEQKRRHNVKPGITGLAQINGRNQLGWEEKFKLDVQYVDNVSLRLDLLILFKTIAKVVGMGGVNSGQPAQTVEPFVPRSDD